MAYSALRPVYRLYDDKQRAFLTAVRPKLHWQATNGLLNLKITGTTCDRLAVAVSARSAGNATGAQRRLCVAVKDLYRVKGLKTSLNNLSYYDTSDEAALSAAVVESLVRDGAIVLGLTKLSSMIAREEPMDASPVGSSSGPAVAVASYPWLDCVLGSDTSGSGRRLAMVNEVWQFRPSHDLVDSDGMVTTYPRFNPPCVFSRELGYLDRTSYTVNSSYEIVFLEEYLPVSNPDQMALINGFIEDMLAHLPATLTKISVRDAWENTHPTELPESVDEYLRDVTTQIYYYAFYHSTDSFRKDYAASHNGEPPYVIPFLRHRWEKGAAVTTAQHDNATKKKSALDELFLSPILEALDIVVPIGDVPYESTITQKIEYLPVVANVVGAPGTDFQLLRTISQVMKLSERPPSVAVGSRMFPLFLHNS
ncbi:amidase signature enzyme [Xylaria sp. FL1042]|nr:amidase signature enzyme [Xylaria sp. FL1042]